MSHYFLTHASLLALAVSIPTLSTAQSNIAVNNETGTLDEVIVTAPAMLTPLEISFNPRTPQQPLPANDGASLLKTIPGMNVIRKGGTDGDPIFRGMAGSRLQILTNGEVILGGCGGRMDPPTAYITPDSYDKVTLLKGPQTVIYGPSASAGVVLFETKPIYFSQPGWSIDTGITGASFGRHDETIDLKAGNQIGFLHGIITNAQSQDYEDGDGKKINSKYKRNSASVTLGWTPDPHTRLELSSVSSDAKAAYADRGMDGSKFQRTNYGLKFEKSAMGGILNKIEAQAFYNYIDHVMDNYSLRTPPSDLSKYSANNPDRKTTGGRVAFTLIPSENLKTIMGADYQTNLHTLRKNGAMGDVLNPYQDQARLEDAKFRNTGIFLDMAWYLSPEKRILAGLRNDYWQAKDNRENLVIGNTTISNPSALQQRNKNLTSGFTRYEYDFSNTSTAYIGFGHAKRAPDYWELFSKEGQNSSSAFGAIRPETVNQLDFGFTSKSKSIQIFTSAFYNQTDDFILIESKVSKTDPNRTATIARNIKATTWGGEAGILFQINSQWQSTANLSYTRGKNQSDHVSLAQMPPLEMQLGLNWDNNTWFVGNLLRLAQQQNRYSLNQGNIVGQDQGRTPGFGIFSVNGGYRWNKTGKLSFGIDNLFNKTYAESINRNSVNLAGYEPSKRVNEPGRTLWIKTQLQLN